MALRTFFAFVNARGENVIDAWLADIPWQARDEINIQLALLRNVATLNRPAAGHLKGGKCHGLIEIRVAYKRRQFRPLGYYGPEDGQVTLLIGAEEKGGEFEPKNACKIARNRIKDIETRRGTVREHRYRSE